MKMGFNAREDFRTDKGLHSLITSGKPNFSAPATNTQFDLTQSARNFYRQEKGYLKVKLQAKQNNAKQRCRETKLSGSL